jgi:acetyltransferase-like isoleucine patch superfamily enzyme
MFNIIRNKILSIVVRFRNLYWKLFFKKFGSCSNIFGRITVYNPENVEIGENSTLNEGVLLNGRTNIKIGSFVHISSYCILNTGGLEYSKTMEERKHNTRPIEIEDGVWIGSGAIINPGVKIRKNSVIGAGAVVTSDIPENSVAVGVPARIIKKINN